MSGIGGIMGLAVSGGQTSGQQFLTSGTFNIPSGIQFLEVLLVGGGGSGGKYTWNSTYSVASGGGAGEILFGKIYVAGLTQIAVTIGAGGAQKSTNGHGNSGGASSIGNLIIANGGSAGQGVDNRCSGGRGGGHYFATTSYYAAGQNEYRNYSGGTGSDMYMSSTQSEPGLGGAGGGAGNFAEWEGIVSVNTSVTVGAGGAGGAWVTRGTIGYPGQTGAVIVWWEE